MTGGKLPDHEVSEGNVFEVLGLDGAGQSHVKAQIVAEIYKIIKERKLTQTKAGALMGIDQPSVSRMLHGHFREYSVERLLQFLTVFDRDVEIVIRRHEKPGRLGQVTVSAA